MRLRVLDRVPEALLTAKVREIADVLPEPTLIHLDGQRRPALFVAALLHGDESTGLVAVQQLLRRYRGRTLPRALSVFIGNVDAARTGVRRLPEQPDFNRIWPGGEASAGREAELVRDVVASMRARGVFASVDLHNNSGLNPHYACVNRLDPGFLQLATLFSRTVVYFVEPRGVQSAAFAELCPSVALECGNAGDEQGERRAAELLDAVLHLSELPDQAPAASDIDLFQTVAIVKVPAGISMSFDGSPADLEFRADLDLLNFSELAAGTELARVRTGVSEPIAIAAADGSNRWRECFEIRDARLLLRQRLMPSMLTRSAAAVRQDCLCYLMQRMA